jgi:hypothetical protein
MILNPRPQFGGTFGGMFGGMQPGRGPMLPTPIGTGGFYPGSVNVSPRPISRQMQPQMGAGRYPMMGARPILGSFKNGGKVKKTGLYKLHAGEKVTSLKQLMGGKC